MGKRLPKAELLLEVEVERRRLDALLEQLTPQQMTRGGATLAGWSVKDILGHLIEWCGSAATGGAPTHLGQRASRRADAVMMTPSGNMRDSQLHELRNRAIRCADSRRDSFRQPGDLAHTRPMALRPGLTAGLPFSGNSA